MKKKLLAFLLAVIMVAATVCTTAVTVIAVEDPAGTGTESPAPGTQSTGGTGTVSGGGSGDEPAVVYPEVDRTVAVAELLDEKGAFLANLAALDATALSYVKDGYTIRLLKDISATTKLTISTPGVKWTLDAVKEDGTSAVYTYTGTGYALQIVGADQHVTVKALVLNSNKAGIQAGDGDTANTLVLENVQIRCDNSSATSKGSTGSSIALFNDGDASYVQILGAKTLMQTVGSTTLAGEAIKNTGLLEVYDGYFYTHSAGNGVINATSANGASSTSSAKVVIFGGTFIGGSGTKAAMNIGGGSTVLVMGGTFYFNHTGNYTKAFAAKMGVFTMTKGGAYLYITGGSFYNAFNGTTKDNNKEYSIFGCGSNASAVYVNVMGGNFYSNMEIGLKQELREESFTSNAPYADETKYYGIEIGNLYKVTAEVLADNAETVDVVENQFTYATLGVPASEFAATVDSIATFTLGHKEVAGYNTECDAYINGAPAFALYNPVLDSSVNYLVDELAIVLLSLTNGGRIELLRNVTLEKALNMPSFPATFEWTLTSKARNTFTLSIEIEATNTDANSVVTEGYIFYVNGGTLNLERIVIQNPKGGVFVTGTGTVLNVKKGAEIIFGVTSTNVSTNAICATGGEINIYEDSYLYPPASLNYKMALVRLFGPSTLTVHKGASVGTLPSGKVPDQSAGYLIWISHKDAVVHVYGEVAANYGRAVQGRDPSNADGDATSGGKLYVYDGAKFTAPRSNAGVITLYDTEVHIYGGDLYQPETKGAENSIFMIVPSGAAKTNLYIHGGTFHDSVSDNGRMIMSKANSYVEITGGTFFGVSHTLFLMKGDDSTAMGAAPQLVIKNATDEEGGIISIPHFYGPNGKPMVDLRQNAICEISGGEFHANYTGGLIQMYAAGLTVTGGDFYNPTGNFLAITRQSGDANRKVIVNDVYIDGANSIIEYKTRFLDVTAEASATAADSPGVRTITVKNVTVKGESHFLYMKACEANVIFENVTATTTGPNPGAWITSGYGSITFKNCNLTSLHESLLYFPSSDDTCYHVTIDGGVYQGATYAVRTLARSLVDREGAMTGITIKSGTFQGNNGKPLTACVSIEAGACTIEGGTFITTGAQVVYVGGGDANTYLGHIHKNSTANLVVNGGTFVLAENGRGLATDAAIVIGSQFAFATVTINGGEFVSQREGSTAAITKMNDLCTVVDARPVA